MSKVVALAPDRSTLPWVTPFSCMDRVNIRAGTIGMVGLVAYTGGGPAPHLLQRLTQPGSLNVGRPNETQVPTSLTQAKAAPKNGRLETTK
jgi:hypothetical protein